MSVALIRMVLRKLGVPVLTHDAQGNTALSVDGTTVDARIGNGLPTPITVSRDAAESDNRVELINLQAINRTITIQAGMSAGFGFDVIQGGANAVTIAAGGGVTITGFSGFVKTGGIGARITIKQIAPNSYVLSGQGAV